MELRQLRYFVEVARVGTYLGAAERLHVAQPALWKQVKALERELGVLLFERMGRRVRLTRAGALVLEEADRALGQCDHLRSLAGDLREGRIGVVTVACTYPHVQRVLARAVGILRRSSPGIRVQLVERSVLDPMRELAGGSVDAVAAARHPSTGGFKLYDVRIIAALPDHHPWRVRSRIAVRQLRDEPLVVFPPGFLSRTRLEEACRAAGFEPRIEAESTGPGALVALGKEGVGIPILADDTLPAPARPWPVLVGPNGPLREEVWLSWREPSGPSPALDAFLDAVRMAVSATTPRARAASGSHRASARRGR